MIWYLQTEVFDENLDKFKEEITKQGHEYIEVDYKPFKIKYPILVSYPVLAYGSLSFVELFSGCTPGMWRNLEKLKCTNYYPYYGKFLINKDYTILPFGELERCRETLFERFGVDEEIFIRPNSGKKPFSGGLLNFYESTQHFLAGHLVFPEELIIVSSPKQIWEEWRLVVCGNKIVSGSRYHKDGLLDTSPEVDPSIIEYGYEIIKDYKPERCFVLDVGLTSRYEYGLVEINSFSCSGFYESNISEIVQYASLEAQKEYDEYK